jgi:hypothetical protein
MLNTQTLKGLIMTKLFQLASLILMGLMLFSIAPASAAFIPPHKTITTPDSTPCTAICAPTTTVATDDLIIRTPPTIDPCAPHLSTGPVRVLSRDLNGVNLPPRVVCGGKSSPVDCAAPLGHLPDVSEREVRSVDGQDRIKLIPICDRLDASLTQAQQNLGLTGNAESLVPAIARNPILTAALGRGRYSPDDVLGIVMGTDTVMLYVHKM